MRDFDRLVLGRRAGAGLLFAGAASLALAPAAFAQVGSGQAGAQTGTREQAESEPPVEQTPGDAGITQAQADTPPGSGEIIVTAQKRAQRLIDVPLAVTAVGGDALAARQINDSAGLVAAVPSLNFQQGNNPTNTSFRIRGVGTQLFGQGVESSVGIVLDGVPAARQAQGFAELADIERVEVLRGPQGTLFGKNATAGVINVVTARPSRQFGGRADFTIAEEGEYRARGTVTGPIGETLRARLTGYYSKVGGYLRNVTLDRDVNGSENYGIRGKLEWDATEDLNILFSADYRNSKSDCCASVPTRVDNPTLRTLLGPSVAPPQRTPRVNDNADNFADSSQFIGSVHADWDFGGVTLTSISAYQKYKLDTSSGVDMYNSPQVLFLSTDLVSARPAAAPFSVWDFNRGRVDLDNYSQELRLSSSGNRDFTWVVGVFYNNSTIERPFDRRRARCLQNAAPLPALRVLDVCPAANIQFQSTSVRTRLKQESISGFGQAEARIFGGLTAIAGLRVQHESGRLRGANLGALVAGDALFPGLPTSTGITKSSDDAVTGKAGLQYEFSRDAQAYATYTRGYKGEAFSTEAGANFANNPVLEPETVNAYEAGFKFTTADRTFSFNAAAFLAKYRNLQVQANRSDAVTGVVAFVQTNAGTSEAKGFEIEGQIRPSDAFSLNFGATYSKSTVDINGLNCPLQFQNAAASPLVPVGGTQPFNTCFRSPNPTPANPAGVTFQQNLRGATTPSSPRWRINLSPRFDQDLSETYAMFAQVNLNFQSDQNFSLEQDPLAEQDAYALVDASVGLRRTDDLWNVTLFVKNLFDKNYVSNINTQIILTDATSPFTRFAQRTKDADRYFGATFGVRF